MPRKCLFKRREQVPTLFTQGREVTADATEDGNPLVGAKAARDFLLHLDHAQIPLRLIVVKGHGKVMQEGQNLPFVGRKPIKQIAGWVLFGAASMHLFRWRGRRIGLVALREEQVIPTMKSTQSQDIQFSLAHFSCLFHRLFHVQQQIFHPTSPGLVEFLFDEGQFSQMMDIAQGVAAGVSLVACQPIVNRGARKVFHHADGFERLASSFWVGGIMGQLIRRADVNPLPRFADPQSGFILVDHRSLQQGCLDLRFHLRQLVVTGSDKRRDAACREVDSQQILQQVTRAGIGA